MVIKITFYKFFIERFRHYNIGKVIITGLEVSPLKRLTILIPNAIPPYFESRFNRQINNIINKLKEKCNLKEVWLVFQPEEIKEIKKENLQVINWQNFNDAFEVLNDLKPDLVLVSSWLDFSIESIVLGAKSENIPVVNVVTADPSYIKEIKLPSRARKKLKILFSKKLPYDISKNKKKNSFRILKFEFNEYKFFINTIKKMNINLGQKINWIINFPLTILTEFLPSYKHVSGDINLYFTKDMKIVLKDKGYPDSNLILIGNPDFDLLYSKIQQIDSYEESHKTNRCLFCTSTMFEGGYWRKEDEEKLIIKTIKKIQSSDKYNITLKIHPTVETFSKYQELFEKNDIHVPILQSEKLDEILKNYDVVITYGFTSAVLFSVLFKKSIIYLDVYEENYNLKLFYDNKIMTLCNNIDDLIEKIEESKQKIILKKDFDSYIEKNLGKFDGKSSERGAGEIMKLILKKNDRT